MSFNAPLLEEDEGRPSPRSRQRLALALGLGAVLLLSASAVEHREVSEALERCLGWCSRLGPAAPALLALLIAALQLLMVPTFPLMVGAGVVFPRMFGDAFGQVVGVCSVFAGVWLGSMTAFLLGRRVFKEWAEAELAKFEYMTVINSMVEEQGWWVVLLARSSPLLPLEVFNYACSLTSLSPLSYGVGCLGSIFPSAIWVCSSASAVQAIKARAESQYARPGVSHGHGRLIFLGCNIAFLVAVSVVLYMAVRAYKARVELHVEKHLEQCSGSIGDTESPTPSRRSMSRQISSSVLRMERPKTYRKDFYLQHATSM